MTFPTARLLAPLSTLLALLILAGCNDSTQKTAVQQPRVEGNAVIFPAGSAQTAALATEKVEPRREALLRFNGRLVWDEDRTVRVISPFGGRVQSIAVRQGDAVRAGQTLAVLSAPELGLAQSEARKAEQDDVLAKKSLARVTELVEAGVAPAKDLQAAQAEAARAAAEHARTQARLRAYGGAAGAVDQRFALTSPIAGVVVERNINPGQELRADAQGDKALFVVSDPAHLWFLLDAPHTDVGALKPGMRIRLSSSTPESERFDGQIVQIADFVDPQTRAVKVRGTVDNAERKLKAEMFVIARVRVPATTGLLVPAKAIYLRGEQSYVFVDTGGGRFERKQVKLGPSTDKHQVVLEGLGAEDRVVVDGNLLLERLLASRD